MATTKKTLKKLWRQFESSAKDVHYGVGIAVAIALGTLFIQSGLTYWDATRGAILFFGIIGYAGIWWFGIRPTNLKAAGIGGFFYGLFSDTDKSQGVAQGLKVLAKFVQDIAWAFLVASFFMATWPFGLGIFLSWMIMAGVLILSQMGVGGKWRIIIVTTYVVGAIIWGLWNTSGVYAGAAFDPDTGEALYMVDPLTGHIDSEGRTPADCVSVKCYSNESADTELVPMTTEQAHARNPLEIGAGAAGATSDLIRRAISGEASTSVTRIGDCENSSTVRYNPGVCFVLNPGDRIVVDPTNQPQRFKTHSVDPMVIVDPFIRYDTTGGLTLLATAALEEPMVIFTAPNEATQAEIDTTRNRVRARVGLSPIPSAAAAAAATAFTPAT